MTHLAELAASRRSHPRRGRLGGIPDIVEPDRNGFLVHRGDAPALPDALVRMLGDREVAERLGRGARETARDLEGTPDRYAASVRRLVEQVLAET
jgi:glycosyltransferase involved in cell wall biosynthesis